jgi:hypothetical protein
MPDTTPRDLGLKALPLTLLATAVVGYFPLAVAKYGGLLPGLDMSPSSVLFLLAFLDVPYGWRHTLLIYVELFGTPVAFLAWHPRLLLGSRDFPRRSAVLIGVIAILSGLYYATRWGQTFHTTYQGSVYAYTCLKFNLMLGAMASLAVVGWRRHPSFGLNLTAHACIFRSKATTHSSRRRPPIPIEGDH